MIMGGEGVVGACRVLRHVWGMRKHVSLHAAGGWPGLQCMGVIDGDVVKLEAAIE